MCHISQLADFHVARVEDVAEMGDEIMVMVTDVSSEGKIRLSRQAVLAGWTLEEARQHDKPKSGGGRGGRGSSDRNRRPRRN
jgi:polyribonucleotide nucleotidyltransferase